MAEQLKEHIKDPGSAITHFIGMLMAIFAAIPLLLKAAREPSKIYIIAIAVYAASLILLYAASTTYHTFDKSRKVNTILKKIDHMMISVLIAGSYTPICLLVLGGRTGLILLAISPIVPNFVKISTAARRYLHVMLLINTVYQCGQIINTVLISSLFRCGGDSKYGMKLDRIREANGGAEVLEPGRALVMRI